MLTIFSHCCGARRKTSNLSSLFEKSQMAAGQYSDTPTRTREQTIHDVTDLLQNTTLSQAQLKIEVADVIHETEWWDAKLAAMLFSAIEDLLRSGSELAAPMQETLHKVLTEAKKIEELAVHFVGEHPLAVGIVCAIVALGCAFLFWPAILDILGFGAEGPLADSFAAWWQSCYGDVPYGSLFSYLQRLGMLAK